MADPAQGRRAVNVVIRDADGRVLLLQRSPDDGSWPGAWNLPGGGVEPGETLEDAVRRESLEETGYRVEPDGPVLDVFVYGPEVTGRTAVTVHAFPARVLDGTLRLDAEHVAARWAGPDDWRALACTPSCASLLGRLFGGRVVDGAGGG